MYKLNATHVCPGISYLNTAERPMYLLNYVLESLNLSMDLEMPEWIHEILNSVSSMKGVHKIITNDDDSITYAIDAL